MGSFLFIFEAWLIVAYCSDFKRNFCETLRRQNLLCAQQQAELWVKMLPAHPHFSWKPCDETKGGGRKLQTVCGGGGGGILLRPCCFTFLCKVLCGGGLVLILVCFLLEYSLIYWLSKFVLGLCVSVQLTLFGCSVFSVFASWVCLQCVFGSC